MGTGEDEASKHCAYSTGTDFEMKEERRAMISTKDKDGKRKKAKRHSSTKAQHTLHSKQLCDRSKAFAKVAKPLFEDGVVRSRRAVHNAGRRVKDKDLTQQQMDAIIEKKEKSRK